MRWTRRHRKPANPRYRASATRASTGNRSTRKTRLIDFYRPTTSNEHPIGSVTCPCAPLTSSACAVVARLACFSATFAAPDTRGPRRTAARRNPSCQSAFDDAPRALVTALAIPLPKGRAGIERVGDRDCLSAFASCCRAIDELSLVLSYLFRPSPARTRLGASSASPERSRTTSFDTLVARSAPFGASRAEDRSCPPRVNATSSFDPGCLRLRAVIEGAAITVSRDHLSRSRFHGHEPRSPATSPRFSHRASASALSFRASLAAFTETFARRSGSLVRSWASLPPSLRCNSRLGKGGRSVTRQRLPSQFRSASTTHESSSPRGHSTCQSRCLRTFLDRLISSPPGRLRLVAWGEPRILEIERCCVSAALFLHLTQTELASTAPGAGAHGASPFEPAMSTRPPLARRTLEHHATPYPIEPSTSCREPRDERG